MAKFMRLFIAINFTDEVKDKLYQTVLELKKNAARGTFTNIDNLHLTLVFIGETKEYETIKEAMNLVVEKTKAKTFQLLTGGLGKFNLREGDTYWVGVKQNTDLTKLTSALVKELKRYGFYIEDREYKPHLTLGRRIVLKEGFDLKDFKETIPDMEVKVDKISLLQSERIEGKLVYTEVYSCSLE